MDFGMNNNVYDPVLQPTMFGQSVDLQKAQEELKQKYLQAEQMRKNGYQLMPESKSPIWDEIDRITQNLTEQDFSVLQQDEEFAQSQAIITALLNREYMRVMKPVVEQTSDGQEALKKHLELLRKKVKEARNRNEREDALWREYRSKYGDMTWKEFLKMKGIEG